MALAGAAGGRITAGAGANLIGIHSADRNPDATCYVGNIDMQATEDLIWELFVQSGPVGELSFEKDKLYLYKHLYFRIPGATAK
jgi:splicing factor 3B subunit 4